jgi:hypothetical protein
VNPHGLDAPNHYSSAADLATLTAYAMDNPVFSMTVSTKQVAVGERLLQNHNKLLWRLEGVNGVKTGYTKAAGRLLVSSAVRCGRELICVTINAPDDWNDHSTLTENGFKDYSAVRLIEPGQLMGTVSVIGSDVEQVQLLAGEGFSFSLRKDEKVQFQCAGPGFVYAPVAQGQQAGVAHICIGDTAIGTVRLLYGQTVEMILSHDLNRLGDHDIFCDRIGVPCHMIFYIHIDILPESLSIPVFERSSAEICFLHSLVVREFFPCSLESDLPCFQYICSVRNGQRSLRVLLNEEDRSPLVIDLLNDMEDL